MMPFVFTGKKWVFSIYSTHPEIDCSVLAKKYGGGGHKGAAGFQCIGMELPLEFLKKFDVLGFAEDYGDEGKEMYADLSDEEYFAKTGNIRQTIEVGYGKKLPAPNVITFHSDKERKDAGY